jgi:F-type H+-transporting ATPase subunit b
MNAAKELKAEYEKRLAAIDAEKSEILELAHKQADEKGRRMIEEAKQEAKVVLDRAVKDAQAEKENVKEEVRRHIIDVSSLLASKFVEHSIDEKAQDKLFDEAITELERATWPS